MKYVYAFRRSAYYPFNRQGWRNLPAGNALNSFLEKVSGMGFDGIELGLDYFSDDISEAKDEASELQKLLEGFGSKKKLKKKTSKKPKKTIKKKK